MDSKIKTAAKFNDADDLEAAIARGGVSRCHVLVRDGRRWQIVIAAPEGVFGANYCGEPTTARVATERARYLDKDQPGAA